MIQHGPEGGSPLAALTFDDGPDPRYTPRVLQVLAQAGARATFFLVAGKAQQNPELVKAIAAAGHEVGSHGMDHRHAWLEWPWSVDRRIGRAAAILRRLSGQPVHYLRPPWGMFNAGTYPAGMRHHRGVVLWSCSAGDWNIRRQARDIAATLEAGLKPGAILVLHDSGGDPGAPEHTLAALPAVLEAARRRGLKLVTVSELVGQRRQST
ncbi:MAG: polysaccharide deacetylase family protein [Firmicutes bacterium]|nr:polysaccharide deacetylase family protein [Bacillota bacterium]